MSCYVDKLTNYGWKLGSSCHLIADSVEELHEFADSIGLKRSWFQPKSTPHYDLTSSKRIEAVKSGAIELGRLEFVTKIRDLRSEK
jgi:hypothetical protein